MRPVMGPFYWSLILVKRHWKIVGLLCLMLAILGRFFNEQIQLAKEQGQLIQSYEKFPFDVISYKTSGLEILDKLFKKSRPPSSYLPSNLFKSLHEGPIEMIGWLDCGSNEIFSCAYLMGDFSPWINLDRPLSELGETDVYISKTWAEIQNIQIGDTLNFQQYFNGALIEMREQKLIVRGFFTTQQAIFEKVALLGERGHQALFKSVEWTKEQIWKNEILNLILVRGDPFSLRKLSEVVNKRTVSQMFFTQTELQNALSFLRLSRGAQQRTMIMGIVSGLCALLLILIILIQKTALFAFSARRLGWYYREIVSTYAFLILLIGFASISIFWLIGLM